MLKLKTDLIAHTCLSLLFAAVLSGEAAAGSMVEVQEGEFIMGDAESHPPQKVFLKTFFIGRHEVTNGEFAARFPKHTFPNGAEEHPVSNIAWHEANEYCRLTGSHLPPAAQWEKSARGTDGRVYPWGNKIPRKPAHPSFSGVVKRRAGTVRTDFSPCGIYGMAGSVWEWTAESGSV